ncbi:MAG: WYL domain-containing protein, partial [Elusimicrobiota bacterium]
IGADGRHRALIDVHLTRKVLMYFMNELSKNNSARLMNFVNERIYESIYAERDRRVISNLPIIIEEAIKNRRKIHIKYISSEGKLSERVVEPKEVVFKCNALYLIGYCHLRGEERSFKLERFLRVELID